jgi:2-polyprenyl-6-methoxyphenol hydroxylase-like FAD-dependent oxidoreductase
VVHRSQRPDREDSALTHDVSVLIVGGGPVGLTASILLSRFGVSSRLVERHPGTAVHPKARGINARTMEIYRQCGVEQAIRDAGLPRERVRFIVWARTLAGEELERRIPWRSGPESDVVSPVPNCLCAQDDLEPVLRAAAERLAPTEVRFGTELTGFEQDAGGITATLADRTTGGQTRVRAQYLIAADGAQSHIRRTLGIPMVGHEAVYESVNVLLRADLTPWTSHRPAALYFIEHPRIKATFLTINGADRWGFLANSLAAYGLTAADFTPERSIELIRLAAGVPDLPVQILGIAPWIASAHVAARYGEGRIFLAGDAAHEMPPTGGFGLNTGVQDVHNLVWKLAAVLQGWAGPSLLDTYDAERRPVGQAITEQSLANSISMGRLADRTPGHTFARPEFLNEQGMIFGASYRSTAVIPDGTPPPVLANPVTDYVPSARPGSRAPHAWLERDGARLSTIDLFGRGFVLLAGWRGARWCETARRVAEGSRLPLDAYLVGDAAGLGDPDAAWLATYGIDEDGAVLVRPDGHVAWRGHSGHAEAPAMLAAALTNVVGRSPSVDLEHGLRRMIR